MGKQEAWGKHTFRESWAGEALWERHESPGGVLPAKRSGWATGPDMAAGEVMPPQSATWRDHPSTCLPAAPSTQLHGSGQQHQETGVLGPALKEAVDGVPNLYLLPREWLREDGVLDSWLFGFGLPGSCAP